MTDDVKWENPRPKLPKVPMLHWFGSTEEYLVALTTYLTNLDFYLRSHLEGDNR